MHVDSITCIDYSINNLVRGKKIKNNQKPVMHKLSTIKSAQREMAARHEVMYWQQEAGNEIVRAGVCLIAIVAMFVLFVVVSV
jgi:hypothetical protein